MAKKDRNEKAITEVETVTGSDASIAYVIDESAEEERPIGYWIDQFHAAERTSDPAAIRAAVRKILAIDPHWGAHVPAVVNHRGRV